MKIDEIHTVLVIGAGTLGGQIALQCAMHGLEVNLYDISSQALDQGMQLIQGYVTGMTGSPIETQAVAALSRIHPLTDPEKAAQVELVSESVPEDPQLKGNVFAQFNALCPPQAIFTTNTSTLLPSMYAQATGRPDRFAAMHFHGYVWISNVVDIMPHPGTSTETLDLLEAFAHRIGQIPIRLAKESHAYVFNAMLNAFLRAATSLAAKQVTSFENVDRAWMGVIKTQVGPFGILDQIGLETAYDINQYWAKILNDAELQANADFLKSYVDQGWLGVKTGRGFYSYPDPEYLKPGFVSGEE
ncbi:MAG: 3-hydroxyacyl-CoA dehydrogenase [Anaerolineaceae bacterium]|nr:3-hydroxyacyl-CoA dehydrogenase [Anaerolineaceae bacterium]